MKNKKIYPQQVREWLAKGFSLQKIRDIFHQAGHRDVSISDLRRLYGDEEGGVK